MEQKLFIEYLKWGDKLVFELVQKLDRSQIIEEKIEGLGSIHQIILHLVEEYTAWLYDIRNQSWKEVISSYQTMDYTTLIEKGEGVIQSWWDYIQSPDKESFEIDEGDGLVVSITLDEVIFNLVNHATYHRGQIVKILRVLGIKVPMTDYYWFKISRL